MAYDLNGLYTRIQRSLGSTPYMSLHALSAQLGVERHTIEKAVKQQGSCFQAGLSLAAIFLPVHQEQSGLFAQGTSRGPAFQTLLGGRARARQVCRFQFCLINIQNVA
jgi:hypothetical protein